MVRVSIATIVAIVLILFCAWTLVGCKSVPVLDPQGNPVMNEDGTPKTKLVADPDVVEAAGNAAAGALLPPWNLLLSGGIGLAGMIRKD